MTQPLQRGQRLKLTDLTPALQLKVSFSLTFPSPRVLDCSCFGLDAAQKLSDDRYFVFYNQPESPEKAIKLESSPNAAHLTVNLAQLPATIQRLVFVATLDNASTMAELRQGQWQLSAQGRPLAVYNFTGHDFRAEKALMIAALYLKDGWRVQAIGQGFDGGLRELLYHFGGTASDAPPTPSLPPIQIWTPIVVTKATMCKRCGQEAGLFGQFSFNKKAGRCGRCDGETQQALQRFRQQFLMACQDGILTTQEWQDLTTLAFRQSVELAEALAFVRGDALNFLERTLTLAAADGLLSEQEEADFYALQNRLEIPASLIPQTLKRLHDLKAVTLIRQGQLPTVRPTVVLDSDEICHMETPATYWKVHAKSVNAVAGRLIATNKQLHFISPQGGTRMKLSAIMRVEELNSHIILELSVKGGNGRYDVANPLHVAAVIDALVRLNKRQLLAPQTERASRKIPHEVRIAVWQRDQGKCTQCGAGEYLEFDHLIPHSKGGASSVNNVQLLCRKCNLAKSDKV